MIHIDFSETDIRQLRHASAQHPHPLVRQKAMALVLKSERIPHHQIASALNICENTLYAYLHAYQKGGFKELSKIKYKGSLGSLKPFDAAIREYLDKTPPSSVKQACEEIEKLTGVRLSTEATRIFLKKLGVSYRKVAGVPAKANIAAQEEFKKTKLEPRIKEAKDGFRELYFVDAAHFVLGAFLGFLWSFTRVFVRTPSGRKRFNVLGALNAISKELVMVTNDSYITSIQVCELLHQIAAQSLKPVTIVLDNARYQRCELVMTLADKLGIELLFLPPYSPNLNLIERLWKFTKKQCLNSRYYEDFNLFRGAISGFLNSVQANHSAELNSLLTLKFQTFTPEQIRQAI